MSLDATLNHHSCWGERFTLARCHATVVSRLHQLPLSMLLALGASSMVAAAEVSVETRCTIVLAVSSNIARCSFVVEKGGAQYYLLEQDHVPTRADSGSRDLVIGAMSILSQNLDHPLAGVRARQVDGTLLELTRGEYNHCRDLVGDDPWSLQSSEYRNASGKSVEKMAESLACIVDAIRSQVQPEPSR